MHKMRYMPANPTINDATTRLLQELGERLRLARLRRGLSAQSVADAAGTTRVTLHRLEAGPAAEDLRTLEAARDAQVRPRPGRRAGDPQHFALMQCERPPDRQPLAAAEYLERSAEDHTPQVATGLQRRAGEADFQRRRVRRVADEGVAEGQGVPVRRAPEGHTQAAATGPAVIDHQRLQAGVQDAQTHANA